MTRREQHLPIQPTKTQNLIWLEPFIRTKRITTLSGRIERQGTFFPALDPIHFGCRDRRAHFRIMLLKNAIASAMVRMQMRVVDRIQRPAFEHSLNQFQCLLSMLHIASVNDCRTLRVDKTILFDESQPRSRTRMVFGSFMV